MKNKLIQFYKHITNYFQQAQGIWELIYRIILWSAIIALIFVIWVTVVLLPAFVFAWAFNIICAIFGINLVIPYTFSTLIAITLVASLIHAIVFRVPIIYITYKK